MVKNRGVKKHLLLECNATLIGFVLAILNSVFS